MEKLNDFDSVEIVYEDYDEVPGENSGACSRAGVYRFSGPRGVVYVLWGGASLPAEISDKVRVTDIHGTANEMEASALVIGDDPVFVEPL